MIHCGDLAAGALECPAGMGCAYDASNDGTPDTCTENGSVTPDPGAKTTLRTVTGVDGASVQVCLDGKMFGPELDLVFQKTWTSTYLDAELGAHKVDSWPYVGQACMSPSSMTTAFNLDSGESYTLFVTKTGFSGVRALKDDFTAPPAGKARVRVARSSDKISAGAVDVCAGSEIWATGLGTSGQGSYAVVTPPSAPITVREATSPACSGAAIATASLNLADGSVYSFFLINDHSQAGKALILLCQDGVSGQQVFNGICSYTPVD
jgi:hypothetical protein